VIKFVSDLWQFWFSLGTTVSSTNKTDSQYITEILLKVALNTVTTTFTQNERGSTENMKRMLSEI
jgi:hypothetical protein